MAKKDTNKGVKSKVPPMEDIVLSAESFMRSNECAGFFGSTPEEVWEELRRLLTDNEVFQRVIDYLLDFEVEVPEEVLEEASYAGDLEEIGKAYLKSLRKRLEKKEFPKET